MEFLKKNWALVGIGLVSLLLGALAVMTALKLREVGPIAPTVPQAKPKAVGGVPVPECTLSFALNIQPTPTPPPGSSPSPTPTPVPTPSASPVPSVSPSPTPGTGGGASPTPTPSATPTPTPTPTPGTGGYNPALDVTKTVNKSTTFAGDTLTYTVTLKNTGTATAYDAFFEETLDQNTTYKAPSMACQFTTAAGSTTATGFQIDNLSDGLDQTPDAESSALVHFRVAGNLIEDNNTWDLAVNDRITCTYQVTVKSTVGNGTNLINNVIGTVDNQNGNQPGETEYTDTASTTVTVVSTQCNYVCTSNSQCPTDLVCVISAGQTSGYCRNPSCSEATNCICSSPVPSASPRPTPSVTPQVPVAGTMWPTIFLVIGGLALLVLGFAL